MALLAVGSAVIAAYTLAVSTLAQISLWQQKEYRADRFISHLREPQGKLTRHPLVLVAITAILLGWLAYLANGISFAEWIGFIGLISFAGHHLARAARRGILRPDFTLKSCLIIALTFCMLAVYVRLTFVPSTLPALQWATAVFFLPGLTALSVAVGNIPFALLKKRIIREATRLRAARPKLRVVGITGSYGKTTAKHFLEHIVRSAGKQVAATEAHHNTPIGIAQDMLKTLQSEVDIYIAELGAYRPGEVQALAAMVRPQIAVLTAIGNQHLDLFGSPENILKTKWELVESLPQDGVIVINDDDPRLHTAAVREKRSVLRYSLKRKADTWVEHVHFEPSRITCTLHLGDSSHGVTLPLASEALLGSTLAAATAALALQVEAPDIVAALTTLAPFPRTMEVRPGKSGATIVDDSYSGNEQGTLIAIRHLSRFPHADRRVVLYPLIELGPDASRVHRRIGEAVRASGAKLYALGDSYKRELGSGVFETDPRRLAQIISRGMSPQTVILLENRIPDVVRNAVLP